MIHKKFSRTNVFIGSFFIVWMLVSPVIASSSSGNIIYLPVILNGEPEKLIFQYSDTVIDNQYSGNTLYSINSDGTNLIELILDLQDNSSMKLSPSGTLISFVSNIRYPTGLRATDIFISNINGTGLINVTNNTAPDYHNEWSPDSNSIYFTSWLSRDYRLYKIDINGSNFTELSPIPRPFGCCAWSNDKTRVIIYEALGDSVGLFVMNKDGSGLLELVESYYKNNNAKWAPDDSLIAFQQTYYYSEIYTIKPNGENLTNITNTPYNDEIIDWSSVGDKLLICSSSNEGSGLFVINIDGSNLIKLADGYIRNAAWSPSGHRVAFVCQGNNICMVDSDGSNLSQVTSFTGGTIGFLEWQPSK